MKREQVKSFLELKTGLQKKPKAFLLLYKKGSEQSDCALKRLEHINPEENSVLYTADVNNVRDIHTEYNIKSAPTLLEFDNGSVKNIYKGCQTETFYSAAISGSGFSSYVTEDGKRAKRVTLYTTPTCTWCNTIKTYLDNNGIRYSEVNVGSDPARAEEMVRKSGQQGVPQTDIEGQVVVGFDKNRINELLEIN